jgi:hypothetical protein
MKKIKQILDYISTLNFLIILVAIFSSCVCLAAFATMLEPKRTSEVYKILFICSVGSYALSYLVLKTAKAFFLVKLPVSIVWLLVIALGSFGNAYFIINILNFTKSSEQAKFSPDYFSVFSTFLLLALIPAAVFRFTMNFAISFWQKSKEKPNSIVN